MNKHDSFFIVLTKAVNDFILHGFDSQQRFEYWMGEIRRTAKQSLTPDDVLAEQLNESFGTIFRRLVTRGELLKKHIGLPRYKLDQVSPLLRNELDRAIMANASLIKLNKAAAIEKTVQRFAGWASSVPAGGAKAEDRVKVKTTVRKALAQLPFEERRVAVDQGYKFAASLNRIVAEGGGAIAARWKSHKLQAGYNGRPDHNERDGDIFLIRDSWAHEAGLVKPGKYGFTDEIEQPGELVFCRCYYVFLYGLSRLPEDMLTQKGLAEKARFKADAA